jgi:CheY-specific phosphatase CheX
MNTSVSKRIAAVFISSAFLFSFTTVTVKVNFSGNWSLNEGKSELGDFGRFVTRKIKTDQKDDAITITKTTPSFSGDDVTTTETLTFDGKTSESTVFGNSKKKSTAKWSDDGNMLTITYSIAFERNGQTFDITGTETWTLVNEGKSLSLQNSSTSPQGERTTKAIYDKE